MPQADYHAIMIIRTGGGWVPSKSTKSILRNKRMLPKETDQAITGSLHTAQPLSSTESILSRNLCGPQSEEFEGKSHETTL